VSGPRRGHVHDLDGQGVLVVSANLTAPEQVAVALVERRHPDDRVDRSDPLVVDTTDADPVTATVLVAEMLWVPTNQLGEPVWALSPATMARVDAGLRAMFDL